MDYLNVLWGWIVKIWEYIPGPWWMKLVIISSAFDIIIGALPEKIARYPGALHKAFKKIYRTGFKVVESVNANIKKQKPK